MSYDKRRTFLYILKAFDKLWHKFLIFKLKSYGVNGRLLKLMENYLTGRQQGCFKWSNFTEK